MTEATTLPKVPWTTVGRTGIRTTKLGIGTWGFGPIGAPESQAGDDENVVAVLKAPRVDLIDHSMLPPRIGRDRRGGFLGAKGSSEQHGEQ